MPKQDDHTKNIIEEFPDAFLGWMLEWAEKRISPAASPSARAQSTDGCAPGLNSEQTADDGGELDA